MGFNYSIAKNSNIGERIAGIVLDCPLTSQEEAESCGFSITGTGVTFGADGVSFDGSGGYLDTDLATLLGECGSLVFDVTVKGLPASVAKVFAFSEAGKSNGFDMNIRAARTMDLYNRGNLNFIFMTDSFTVDSRFQVRISIDGNIARVTTSLSSTIDGASWVGSYQKWGDNRLRLGNGKDAVLPFTGTISNIKIFRGYAFDTAELLTSYEDLFDLESDIVGKWLMMDQDNFSTFTRDTSGAGNNLTKNGTLSKYTDRRGYELDSATVDFLSGSISGLTDFSLILLLQNTKIGSTGELFYLTTPATSVDIADDGVITNSCGGDFYSNKELSGDGKMNNQFWIFGLLGATWGGSNFAISGKMEGGILGAILYDGTLSPLQYFYLLGELFFNRGCN